MQKIGQEPQKDHLLLSNTMVMIYIEIQLWSAKVMIPLYNRQTWVLYDVIMIIESGWTQIMFHAPEITNWSIWLVVEPTHVRKADYQSDWIISPSKMWSMFNKSTRRGYSTTLFWEELRFSLPGLGLCDKSFISFWSSIPPPPFHRDQELWPEIFSGKTGKQQSVIQHTP